METTRAILLSLITVLALQPGLICEAATGTGTPESGGPTAAPAPKVIQASVRRTGLPCRHHGTGDLGAGPYAGTQDQEILPSNVGSARKVPRLPLAELSW